MKLNDVTVETKEENLKSLIQIDLGIEIKGKILSIEGVKSLEADMNQPKIKESHNLATSLSRTIEKLFNLTDNSVQPRIRYTEKDKEKVKIQIHLLVSNDEHPNKEKLHNVLKQISGKLLMSPDMYNAQDTTPLSPEDDEVISSFASDFLLANGGKSISKALQLSVDDKPIATLAGVWCPVPTVEPEPAEIKTITAQYDGRRLRSRTLYAFLTSPRPRVLEIYYDEDRFDAQLRDLQENKNVILSLEIKEFKKGKKMNYELIAFEIANPPEELELT